MGSDADVRALLSPTAWGEKNLESSRDGASTQSFEQGSTKNSSLASLFVLRTCSTQGILLQSPSASTAEIGESMGLELERLTHSCSSPYRALKLTPTP